MQDDDIMESKEEERSSRKRKGAPPAYRREIRAGDPVTRVKVEEEAPEFPQVSEQNLGKIEYRKIRIPPHRYTPLRKSWEKLIEPLTENLKLQVRFNPRTRCVEIKSCAATVDGGAIQKGADYVNAFALGFEVADAVAMLRLEDLFIDSFEVKDVKILRGDHLSRAVGRVAGADGKTRFAIENATRTRIIVANTRIHILGSTANIKVARDSICDLIMGAPPGKVYNRMHSVAKRISSGRY
mmetsp:Transcript_15775/g.20768  ORF Transcript_15775/g.20768 Transcript_15775/m.20768 type:complete len:240 (+) Transcript_15775:88-807(+)